MASAIELPGATSLPSHLVEHEGDPNAKQKGYIKGTDYSLPYSSPWARIHHKEIDKNLLRHINCGYLSTPGTPPTLLALKQHAQSLCILIQALNPTLRSAEIIHGDPTTSSRRLYSDPDNTLAPNGPDNTQQSENHLKRKYELNSAFDFLNDLSAPYTNDDPNHHKPLTGLLNEIRGVHEGFGTDSHCPLMTVKPRGASEPVRMYANHHNLVMHANACLEHLDHEFSPVGGLMGLLPTPAEDPEGDELARARESLLGQWLLFTQHLVGRMHELERSYGNALDALTGEAAIPHQYLSSLGPDARSTGREIAFPQDRYVLVNAGDEIFETIHDLLDRQEELYQSKAEIYLRNGVLGPSCLVSLANPQEGEIDTGGLSAIISPEDAESYARGLIPITLPTRFYRLAGQGHSILFLLPGYDVHPKVEYTRDLETKPTIISSFQPAYPKRASEFEKDQRVRLEYAENLEAENLKLKQDAVKTFGEIDSLKKNLGVVTQVRDMLFATVRDLQAGRKRGTKRFPGGLEARYAALVDQITRERTAAEEKLGHEERLRETAERSLTEMLKVREVLVDRLKNVGVDTEVDLEEESEVEVVVPEPGEEGEEEGGGAGEAGAPPDFAALIAADEAAVQVDMEQQALQALEEEEGQ